MVGNLCHQIISIPIYLLSTFALIMWRVVVPIIKITPDELIHISAELATQRSEAESQMQLLQQKIKTLDWEGISSEQFMIRFEHAKLMMAKHIEHQQIVEMWLKTIAQRFADADQQNSHG